MGPGAKAVLCPAPMGMPHAKLQLLDAPVDGGAADAELARRLGDIALALRKQLFQRLCGGLAGIASQGGARWGAVQ